MADLRKKGRTLYPSFFFNFYLSHPYRRSGLNIEKNNPNQSSSNKTMAEQRPNRTPLFNSEQLLSKRLGSIIRTFE